MNISLTDELEDYVANQVKTGYYKSASEVIREALRNQIKLSMEHKLQSRLNISRQEVEGGQARLADQNYFDDKRAKLRTRYK